MKKKVFRERYNMELVKDEMSGEIKVPALEFKDGKVEPKKRGRKSVKSDK